MRVWCVWESLHGKEWGVGDEWEGERVCAGKRVGGKRVGGVCEEGEYA